MTHSPILTKHRTFGLLEKYQLSKSLTHCYGSVTCSAQLTHQPRPTNDDNTTSILTFYLQQFYPVITHMVQRYPSLSLVVRNIDQAAPYFMHTSSFSLDNIVSVLDSSLSLEEALGAACDQEWVDMDHDSALPLWRLQILIRPGVLDQCTVILTSHHVIMDGASLTLFWQAFIEGLNNNELMATGKQQDWLVTSDSPTTLPTPMEARPTLPKPTLLDYGGLVGGILKDSLLPTRLRQWMGMTKEGWEGDHAAIDGEAHKTTIKARTIGGDTWQTLVQLVKTTFGVSPHAVLHAAFLLAWSEVYPNQSTTVSTPINYRFLSQANNEIGNFVGAYVYYWTPNDLTDIWRQATDYHGALQANKSRSCIGAQFLSLLKYPQDYIGFWQDKRKKHRMGREGGLEHSDLGRFGPPALGAWRLDGLWFAQSAQTYTTALGLNTVTVNDTVYATFGWQSGSIDESKATILMDRYRQAHMVDHVEHSDHFVCLSYSDLSVWCFACDSYVTHQTLDDLKHRAYVAKFNEEPPTLINTQMVREQDQPSSSSSSS
ncbi:hypothetical protein BC941DRAFT_499263 [Chlamydoabsidia padenii]|nr:hypothetical protein BC941DRAFT_499263 [Chlamydoabsidia padenii]